VPKETKKFINPLLRPSPTADARPAQPPQPEVTGEPEEVSQEVVSPKPSETPTDIPQSLEAIQIEQPEALVGAISSSIRQKRSADKVVENTAPETEVATGSGRRNSSTRPVSAREEQQSRNLARSSQSSSSEEARPSANGRSLDSSISLPSDDSSLEEAYASYNPTTFPEDSRATTRRRRNPQQPFEETHERITLWMDKQLKQRFEALAFQRELPKTALINEAVNALLEKYEAH